MSLPDPWLEPGRVYANPVPVWLKASWILLSVATVAVFVTAVIVGYLPTSQLGPVFGWVDDTAKPWVMDTLHALPLPDPGLVATALMTLALVFVIGLPYLLEVRLRRRHGSCRVGEDVLFFQPVASPFGPQGQVVTFAEIEGTRQSRHGLILEVTRGRSWPARWLCPLLIPLPGASEEDRTALADALSARRVSLGVEPAAAEPAAAEPAEPKPDADSEPQQTGGELPRRLGLGRPWLLAMFVPEGTFPVLILSFLLGLCASRVPEDDAWALAGLWAALMLPALYSFRLMQRAALELNSPAALTREGLWTWRGLDPDPAPATLARVERRFRGFWLLLLVANLALLTLFATPFLLEALGSPFSERAEFSDDEGQRLYVWRDLVRRDLERIVFVSNAGERERPPVELGWRGRLVRVGERERALPLNSFAVVGPEGEVAYEHVTLRHPRYKSPVFRFDWSDREVESIPAALDLFFEQGGALLDDVQSGRRSRAVLEEELGFSRLVWGVDHGRLLFVALRNDLDRKDVIELPAFRHGARGPRPNYPLEDRFLSSDQTEGVWIMSPGERLGGRVLQAPVPSLEDWEQGLLWADEKSVVARFPRELRDYYRRAKGVRIWIEFGEFERAWKLAAGDRWLRATVFLDLSQHLRGCPLDQQLEWLARLRAWGPPLAETLRPRGVEVRAEGVRLWNWTRVVEAVAAAELQHDPSGSSARGWLERALAALPEGDSLVFCEEELVFLQGLLAIELGESAEVRRAHARLGKLEELGAKRHSYYRWPFRWWLEALPRTLEALDRGGGVPSFELGEWPDSSDVVRFANACDGGQRDYRLREDLHIVSSNPEQWAVDLLRLAEEPETTGARVIVHWRLKWEGSRTRMRRELLILSGVVAEREGKLAAARVAYEEALRLDRYTLHPLLVLARVRLAALATRASSSSR